MRKLHQLFGLILGVPLFIIGLTGSIYTWQPELTQWYYDDLYLAQENTELQLSDEEVVTVLQTKTKKELKSFYFTERERETYIVQFYDDPLFYFINPDDAKILGTMSSRRGIFDVLLKIHMSFFIEGGKYFVGWVALSSSFIILTSGIYLWYPRRRKFRKKDFWNWVTIKNRSYSLSWHKLLGLYLAPILFVLGISGAFFTFKNEYYKVIETIFQEQTQKTNAIVSHPSSSSPMNMVEAIRFMGNHFTTYYPRSIHLTKEVQKTAYFSWIKNEKGVTAGKRIRPYMNVDIYTHHPIYVFNPMRANAVDSIINKWIPPLHFGELGGVIHRIINSLAGLGLCAIAYLGFIFNRLKRK